MSLSMKPLKTTLIGGIVLLLPLVVTLAVVAEGLQMVGKAAAPVIALLPQKTVGGIALATVATALLLLLLCFAAGLAARAALGRRLSESFENRLHALYPRYTVIKGMTQGLSGQPGDAALKVVLVGFDDQQALALEVERLADGRVVVFLPGAPDPWSGSSVLVDAGRVTSLPVEVATLTRTLKGLGRGTAALLGSAA
jgi:uncharacterized membrane protein